MAVKKYNVVLSGEKKNLVITSTKIGPQGPPGSGTTINKLEDITDVDVTGRLDADALIWSQTNTKWEAKKVGTVSIDPNFLEAVVSFDGGTF